MARERIAAGPDNERREQIIEDALWLHEGGVHPVWWPSRVGSPSLGALSKMFQRAADGGDRRALALYRAIEPHI